MKWKSREPSLICAVLAVCLREKRNEDEEKPNVFASGVIKCYLSFLQYLHWQCFIRDLWPSVLQICCIHCGFSNLKLLWN